MYIYQLDRVLLQKQVNACMHYIHGRVLNVGSGNFERYALPQNVSKCIRMDISPGKNVDVVGRAEEMPFSNNSFDSIISTQVFEHIQNPESAASEVCRVLKKDGYALVTVPQWNELHEEPHDYWRYTKYGLRTLFERHGCKLVSMEQRGGYYTVRAQMSMRYYIDRFHLYKRPILGRISNYIFHIYGTYSQWRDHTDTSVANRKHMLGWCAIFKKV